MTESTAAEMGEYVRTAFFTYDEMREQRDQALARAGMAEHELAAANTEGTRYAQALLRIAADSCEASTAGPGSCWDSGRTIDAKYGADRWCLPCVALDALDGRS